MSGFLAYTGLVSPVRVDLALGRLAYLGGEFEDAGTDGHASLAVTRKGWETGDDFSGPVGVFETAELLVAADATLYDRAGLIRALAQARVAPHGLTPTHLIEAAYRAWGTGLAAHLTGDFAFVIWDRPRHRLVAARDPIGMRPLFTTEHSAGVAVGSSARALAELAGRGESLDVASLGGQISGLIWANGTATAFRGVDPVPGGSLLVVEGERRRIERYWHPAPEPDAKAPGLREAAVMLRELLGTAVSDRLSTDVTTVWMSGGWDSTSVFAAGQDRLAPEERGRLRPVSISYPQGDPGREDEWIADVASQWGASVQWIRSEDIPLLARLEERAALADEPPVHLYELWNSALARGTRAAGSRVALDGCGGDNLFQVSDVVLADHLARGRVLEFVRLARRRRAMGWRYVLRSGVLPLLPEPLVRALETLGRRRLPRHYMEHAPAPWIRREFIEANHLRDRALATLRSEQAASRAQTENILYLTAPAWGWAGGYMRGVLLQEGVEARSPLLDRRIAEFALARPVAERSNGRETKILLRSAMEGLLPASVLAPRARRTGSAAGFSRRRMVEDYPALLAALLAQPLRLAALGVVDEAKLRAAAAAWQHDGADRTRVGLFDVMRVEFWLRGQERPLPRAREGQRAATRLATVSAA